MVGRDYKRSRARGGGGPGWGGVLAGVAAGLVLGLSLYFLDRRDSPPATPAAAPEPASARDPGPAEPSQEYDFYEMLPNFEVVVPEREREVRRDPRKGSVEKAGAYVLQVGSYRNYNEADRIRAQLALQGIESKVQRVSVDNDTWHRVRVGPISDLQELNRVRDRLREAEMEVLVIRVGE